MNSPLKQSIKAISRRLGYEAGKIRTAFPNEPFEAQRQLMSGRGKSQITILDIGANKGQTAEKYRAKFPGAEIYCFEPFPDSVTLLEKKFSHDARIHIMPMAVTNENGNNNFYLNDTDATHSLLPRSVSGRRYYPKSAEPKGNIEVRTTTLDDFVAARQAPAIDILKFDIQGGELMAMRGAKGLLQSGHVSLIYTEAFFIPHYEGAPLFHELWSFLAEFGYSLFGIYKIHRATNGQIRYADVLFVSESIRNGVINKYPEEP
jgi:FkbM family methyltransferase